MGGDVQGWAGTSKAGAGTSKRGRPRPGQVRPSEDVQGRGRYVQARTSKAGRGRPRMGEDVQGRGGDVQARTSKAGAGTSKANILFFLLFCFFYINSFKILTCL